jgi:hypothetical protein
MKYGFKILAVIGLAASIAACSSNTNDQQMATATAPTMTKQQQCASIENQMRTLDRSKKGATKQYKKLDAQLGKLNCGAK